MSTDYQRIILLGKAMKRIAKARKIQIVQLLPKKKANNFQRLLRLEGAVKEIAKSLDLSIAELLPKLKAYTNEARLERLENAVKVLAEAVGVKFETKQASILVHQNLIAIGQGLAPDYETSPPPPKIKNRLRLGQLLPPLPPEHCIGDNRADWLMGIEVKLPMLVRLPRRISHLITGFPSPIVPTGDLTGTVTLPSGSD